MTSPRSTEQPSLHISVKRTPFHHLITIRDGRESQFIFLKEINRNFAKVVWRTAGLDYYLTGNVFYCCVLKSLIKITGSLLLFYL